MTPAPPENDNEDEQRSVIEKGAAQVQRLVGHVLREGVGPISGAEAYAESRLQRWSSPDRAIQRIRNESTLAAGTSGFATGVGGVITLPVTIPASLASALIINVRMVGAIAHLRGYKLTDPHTEALAMLVAAGSSGQTALTTLGVKVGEQAVKQAIRAIPMSLIWEINRRATFMLLAKYGTQRSAITLAKFIPVGGGVVGGTVDAALTRAAGRAAVVAFVQGD